jgi:hypothetical protein
MITFGPALAATAPCSSRPRLSRRAGKGRIVVTRSGLADPPVAGDEPSEPGIIGDDAALKSSRVSSSAEVGEPRLAAALTVAAAIALQLALPTNLGIHPKYLIPALEITLLAALVVANPRRVNNRSRLLRAGGLVLIALVIVANAVSAGC